MTLRSPALAEAIQRAWIQIKLGLEPALVTCSCGLQTHIVFVDAPDLDVQAYLAEARQWQFRDDPGPDNLPTGWYCGKDGHHEANYAGLAAPVELMEFMRPEEVAPS